MSTPSDDPRDEYNATLQEELNRVKNDMKALQSEFNDLAENDDGTLTPDAARKALIAGAPAAIQQIIILSHNADSESVRLNASKYVVDVTLGKIEVGTPADNAFKTLLAGLKKPPTEHNVKKVKEKLTGEGSL